MSDQETLTMVPVIASEHDDGQLATLAITIDLGSIAAPQRWRYDSVVSADGGEVTVLFFPADD